MQITKGKINSAQKIVVYGPEGIGKSTFLAHFPDPLFIDTEGSTKKLDVARVPKPTSWTMLINYVQEVKANPGICGTLVLDTADWAERLCVEHICSKSQKSGIEDFGYGKGYTYLEEEFGRLLNLLEEIVERGVNVGISAHAQMRKFEQPDELGSYDRWELKLEKKTAPLLKEWADMVLFANYKTFVVNVDNQGAAKGKNKAQGGSRVMFTTHHPCWDAKNRDGLKEELPFNFAEIAHTIPAKNAQPSVTPVQAKQPVPEPVTPAAPMPTPAPASETATHKDKPAPLPEGFTVVPVKVPEKKLLSDRIPKPLRDLMETNNVSEEEIQKVVFDKKYFPPDTPIENYPKEFVDGVLVACWAQVYKAIVNNRDLPF